MSLERAVNQQLILNDISANRPEVSSSSASLLSSSRSLSPSVVQPPLSKSPSPISFLTDGESGTGGVSPGSATYSSTATSSSSCLGYSITTNPSCCTTATVKSSSPTTNQSIKFNETTQITELADGANNLVDIQSYTKGTLGIGGGGGGGAGCNSGTMSSHQNSTSTSSTANTPTSVKPPSSPVKFGRSKSRHSSSSDQSACVTPTGGSASATSNISGMGPGPDGLDRAHSIRVTRKIFNNWRSACGRTKDKTKDFIRRWKTLPENQADFETGGESEHQHLHHNSPHGSSGNVNSLVGLGNSMELSSGASGGGGGGGAMNTTPTTGDYGMQVKPSGFSKIKSLTKKFSQDIPAEDVSTSISQSKPSAGWSVHVWATYVQRGLDDEDVLSMKEEAKPGRDLLTEFQKTKLTHFFRHVLDMNHDDVISAADFVALNQRIRHYIEWSPECIEFHVLKEVHSGFLECFLNQPLDDCSVMYYCSNEKETRDHVNLDEWLDVWGTLLETARTLEDLPLWLQYFPKVIFQVINKSGSQKVSKEELRAFYTMFLGIDFRVVNETMDSIYNAMTDGGRNPITYHLFKLCFANFLLGKYPHGPGQFMFGICSPQSLHCNFPIDYSAMNTPPDDLEPYDPHKEKDHSRRSVIV